MKYLLLIFVFISCYNHPLSKQQKPKSKPLFIKQYNERNRKEELLKSKKEILPMKETKIKFTKEKTNFGNKSNKTK